MLALRARNVWVIRNVAADSPLWQRVARMGASRERGATSLGAALIKSGVRLDGRGFSVRHLSRDMIAGETPRWTRY
jgi:hypothetical protein